MARFTPHNQRNAHVNDATFTLDNSHVNDATFELQPLPGVPTLDEQEQTTQEMLERDGVAAAEAAFLGGEIKYVLSSNVRSIQYLWLNPDGSSLEQLYVGFTDGSIYVYFGVPFDVARAMYGASSYGKAVWSLLRERGTVYGHQYEYALVSGGRVWYNAGDHSQARHESLPKSGEPYKGYHSSLNWRAARGTAGDPKAGVNLGKRGGSKKVSIFTPVKASLGHLKPAGPNA